MGERTPLALLDAPASARMAVAEAVTNIAAADIAHRSRRQAVGELDGAGGEPGEDARSTTTVRAVGEELCPALGIAIPVGKDSLSMRTRGATTAGEARGRRAGVADRLGVRAGRDVRRTLTPQRSSIAATTRAAADRPGRRREPARRLVLAQVYGQLGAKRRTRRSRAAARLLRAIQELRARGLLLAYHDRSDGGRVRRSSRWRSPAAAGSTSTLDAGRTPTRGRGAVRRGARRGLQVRTHRRRGARVLARHGLRALRSRSARGDGDRIARSVRRAVVLDDAPRPAARLVGDDASACRRCATTRRARRGARARLDPHDPG